MKNSEQQQQAVTSAIASLAAAEWHSYSVEQLCEFHRAVVEQIYSLCSPAEQLFLDVYGRLLASGALPSYPLLASEFPQNARNWLRKLYELEPTPANAGYYAKRARAAVGDVDIDYRIRREHENDEE